MNVAPCGLPSNTVLDRKMVEGVFLSDSYRVPLTHGDASVVDIFFAIFGHHPAWLKALLLMRHRLGVWVGLNAATSSQILNPIQAESYRTGQTIGAWPIYYLGESELVAGRDNSHLDFRLSVLKQGTGQSASAVVSTVCCTHNRFGRVYLRLIAPFHRWGVKRLISKAADAGRL